MTINSGGLGILVLTNLRYEGSFLSFTMLKTSDFPVVLSGNKILRAK